MNAQSARVDFIGRFNKASSPQKWSSSEYKKQIKTKQYNITMTCIVHIIYNHAIEANI